MGMGIGTGFKEEIDKTIAAKTAEKEGIDIVDVVLQSLGDLSAGDVIIDLLASVRESVGLTREPEGVSITREGGAKPATAQLGTIAGRPFRPELEKLIGASLPEVTPDTLLPAVEAQVSQHIGVCMGIGLATILGTVIPFVRIDRILEAVHSMYALLDPPEIFSQLRDERIAVEWRRPFRYWIESELQNNIPPTADLITFLVREQISLEDFKRIMSYWGYSEEVSDMYWGSHWVLPTTQQLYDMFALGMIDEEILRRQVIINDIHPDWVDRIIELRKRLPSRTELRLMLRRQEMPAELVDRTFRYERLHEDFDPYFRYMLLNWDIDSIFGRIINEAIGQFEDGITDEVGLRTICAQHLASLDEVEAYVTLAKLRQTARRIDEQRDMFIALYKKNYQPRATITEQLEALGFDPIDIAIWLDKAEVDSLPKIQAPTE